MWLIEQSLASRRKASTENCNQNKGMRLRAKALQKTVGIARVLDDALM